MAYKITDKLEPYLAEYAKEAGVELWDVEFVKEGSMWYLRVYIDKEGGIDLEDCERYSRLIDPKLDELDMIDKSYCLEVSSPGLERVLKSVSQMKRYIGETVTVKLFEAIDGKKTFKAELKDANEEAVTLVLDGNEIETPRKNVAKMNLYFEF